MLAVDPGTSPTICVLWDRGESAKWYDTEHTAGNYKAERPREATKNRNQPSPANIRRIMEYHHPDLVVIEKIWVRPTKEYTRGGKSFRGQGVASQAKLIMAMALCDGIAVGLGYNVLRLFPQTWLKHQGLITKEKKFHREHATMMLPKWGWAFTRQKDHDRADAALMAITGMEFLDASYAKAVRRGAPLDHTPIIDTVR